MAKTHKEDAYTAFDRISNRIQYFVTTRCFSSYNTRRVLYEEIQRDINTVDNIVIYEQLMAKLKAAGI